MNGRNVLLVFMLLGAQGTLGQPASSPVSEMTVVGIYPSKPGDTTVYCLLGGSACLSPGEIIHWKPPSDAAMIDVYARHSDWFQQVSVLARDDERLMKVMRSPESIAQARSGGVPQANLDAYVGLLENLGVNETIANAPGLGQLSLVKADIIVGLFDNGIIKGYVYDPANPQPTVKDLENWPPELTNVTTAYRSIGNNWYLFELRH